MTRRRTGDDGFTLPELLVSIVLGGLVVSAVAAGLLVAFRNSATSADRMTGSHNANLLSIYFTRDVASGEALRSSTAPDGTCPIGEACLVIDWTEPVVTPDGDSSEVNAFSAAYAVVVDARRSGDRDVYAVQRTYLENGAVKQVNLVVRDLPTADSFHVRGPSSGPDVTVEVGRTTSRDAYAFTLSGTAGVRLEKQ